MMESWEKARTVGSLLSAVLLPLVLLIVGNQFSAATKEREIQSKFVELSTQILREQPTPESKPLREWATSVINRYSGVEMTQATTESLVTKTALPAAPAASEAPARVGPANWAVVIGGDATLPAAKDEVAIVTKKHGIANASIYLRNGSYRTVAVVGGDRSAAEDALGRGRERRADAYIVNMNTWCPQVEAREGYTECVAK
jgi:hypothetical protein